MRVHTGGRLKMGQGFPILALSKQKLNTRSSIESEIFGFDQLMPLVHWTRNTLEPHGYVVTENIIYQDNKSTILLKNNGKSSISKRTKHINIRSILVTDRIQKKDMSVELCPTGEMTRYF